MPVRDLRVRLLGEDETGPAYDSAVDNADRMSTATAAAFGAAAAAAGLFVVALGDAFNQDQLGDRTAAALALTGPQAEQAGQAAGELFANAYTDSAEEANLAVESVMSSISGMRDASADDIEALAGAALNFSNVMGTDVARSAQIAGQMINSGLATDGTEAFDLLVAASSQVPTAIRGDLVDAVDEYGQFFSQLGYSGEQAMALLVDSTAAGAFGLDKTGDAIKELTISATTMAQSTSPAGQALEAIGLSGDDMANRMLAGGATAQEATQQIITGLLGMTDPAAQAQAAIGLFGTPLEDLNAGQIPAFLGQLGMMNGELEGVAGSADRLGEQLNDNASSRFQAWRQSAQQSLVDFMGAQVIPRIESLTTWIGDNGDKIQTWATVIGTVLLPVLALWGTAALINAGKNVAAWVTTALASGTSAATQSLSAGQVVLAWVVAGTQSLIQGARMAAAWIMAMGPVGWVIAAVVGLVALIVANWDTVVSWTTTAWNAVTGAISAAWSWITGAIGSAISWVQGVLSAGWNAVLGTVRSVWNGITGAISGAVSAGWNVVAGLPGQIGGLFSAAGSWLLSAGRNLLQGLWNGISGAAGWLWRQVENWASGLVDNVLDFFGIASPSRLFAEIGGHLMGGLAQGIDDGADDAVAAVEDAASRVAGAAQVTAALDPALAGSMGMPMAGGGMGGLGAGGAGGMAGGDPMAALLEAIRDLRDRPTVGQVVTQRDETGPELAERLAFMARTGATGG